MIEYQEEWIFPLLFRAKGSLMFRASLFAFPAAIAACCFVLLDDWVPGFREDKKFLEIASSQVWSATTAVLGMLLSFRTSQAMSRFWEGTSLLHQMRGEWFDAVSCCVAFSRGGIKTKSKEVQRFRHALVRLMSLCHGSALEEIKGDDESDIIEVIDVAGLDIRTLKLLWECKETYQFDRVELLLHLQQSLITKAVEDGVITVAAPILSRVYQTLSRGFVNLLNAKKICDTRFPFPYAQLIAMLLLANTALTPVIISTLFTSPGWAFLFTFIPVFGLCSMSFIASELENPFGNDDNDLPLAHFQTEMNSCLLLLLHKTTADHIPDISNQCILDFDKLMSPNDDDDEDVAIPRTSGRARLSHHEAAIAAAHSVVSESSLVSSHVSRKTSSKGGIHAAIENSKGFYDWDEDPTNRSRSGSPRSSARSSRCSRSPSNRTNPICVDDPLARSGFGFVEKASSNHGNVQAGSTGTAASIPKIDEDPFPVPSPPAQARIYRVNSDEPSWPPPVGYQLTREGSASRLAAVAAARERMMKKSLSTLNEGFRAAFETSSFEEAQKAKAAAEGVSDPVDLKVPSEAKVRGLESMPSTRRAKATAVAAPPASVPVPMSPGDGAIPQPQHSTEEVSPPSPPSPQSRRIPRTQSRPPPAPSCETSLKEGIPSCLRSASNDRSRMDPEQLNQLLEAWNHRAQAQIDELARNADAVQQLSVVLPKVFDASVNNLFERMIQHDRRVGGTMPGSGSFPKPPKGLDI